MGTIGSGTAVKAWIYGLIIFLFFCLPGSVSPLLAETPTEHVRAMLDEVLAVQNDPGLQGQQHRNQRREAIKKIISLNFDFSLMAQNALGDNWQKLNDADRREFIGVFQDLFQDSYTRLVLDFLKNEKVIYSRETMADKGRALIGTFIVRANEKIPVDYSLVPEKGTWFVEDVAIESVSIVGNYRRSFGRVIQKESYKSLLQRMQMQQKAIEKSSEKSGSQG